ncbi:Alpha/Beta hydrolase protein [Trametes polyzona]|nr:Alpha/Beta hydrolase protein [Trametes polyzona]
MSALYTGPLGLLKDSGVPGESDDYTTLVIIHGYAWHSGIFSKLLPLAEQFNLRIILLNRRDYPMGQRYTDAERALLHAITPELLEDADKVTAAKADGETFMKERAREVYDFLVQLVQNGKIPLYDREAKKGGIVLAGWSFGTGWMTAFLAHLASFSADDTLLSKYLRRVVFLDPPYLVFGYPPSRERLQPTVRRRHPAQQSREGVHQLGERILRARRHRPYARTKALLALPSAHAINPLKERALYHPAGKADADPWADVEVRYVSCERSVWEMPWGTMLLKREIENARAKGLPIRNIRLVFVKGANHFVHWDAPELALRALVGEEDVVQ